MNEDNKWSISYSTSWTQPYSNWNHPISSINNQMTVIEAVDNIVDHMTIYPDAINLLKEIQRK
tara:strand:- start:834 stop:1022 length:189 start_codon:yes stop_codon:yes gene_type:complete